MVLLYKYVIFLGYALYEELFIIWTYINDLFVKYLSMEIIAFYVNVENGMIEIWIQVIFVTLLHFIHNDFRWASHTEY